MVLDALVDVVSTELSRLVEVEETADMAEDGAALAVLTLQGYQSDQTHLRLQPAARAQAPAQVGALADALYAALRAAGWIPSDAPLLEHTPRFVRPQGFVPLPKEPTAN